MCDVRAVQIRFVLDHFKGKRAPARSQTGDLSSGDQDYRHHIERDALLQYRPNMTDDYDDGTIVCGPNQLEIHFYYFPFGTSQKCVTP
jgi:hypothetical protein